MTRLFWMRAAAVTLALAPFTGAAAQVADPAMIDAERAAIARLDWMNGTWRGPAATQMPGGEHKVTQTERIGNFLGGTVKVVEGKGFNPDGSVGFNAFAVISYDPGTKAYTFRSYAQGRAGTFTITPTGNGYVWEIPAGPMTLRYTATLESGKWHEVGDRVMPGQPPQRFFDMTLTRVGDTDWPAVGGMTEK
ncbi:MAG: hypothetical protein JWN66_1981 [Sphingomonas bacterium]|uniref:DUF1579 domain-containing protein n=1 Tax=Sphingomonas bacterium TaxID=1895847 RepID=UPI0026308F81|nr:DUF1579 domain-containing protein [Sphingomonas bacterium]MDB5704865.1 hypothetical protein [Sphingomonas bacterium]